MGSFQPCSRGQWQKLSRLVAGDSQQVGANENALLDVKGQYEKQIKELQEAHGKTMLEKKFQSLLGEEKK